MIKKEITFDRFIRGALVVGGLILAGYILSYLSTVLLPFFVACAVAYLLFPIVRFLQYKCRLKNRILSIFVALALLLGTLTANQRGAHRAAAFLKRCARGRPGNTT